MTDDSFQNLPRNAAVDSIMKPSESGFTYPLYPHQQKILDLLRDAKAPMVWSLDAVAPSTNFGALAAMAGPGPYKSDLIGHVYRQRLAVYDEETRKIEDKFSQLMSQSHLSGKTEMRFEISTSLMNKLMERYTNRNNHFLHGFPLRLNPGMKPNEFMFANPRRGMSSEMMLVSPRRGGRTFFLDKMTREYGLRSRDGSGDYEGPNEITYSDWLKRLPPGTLVADSMIAAMENLPMFLDKQTYVMWPVGLTQQRPNFQHNRITVALNSTYGRTH